jgi:hypothetical protein
MSARAMGILAVLIASTLLLGCTGKTERVFIEECGKRGGGKELCGCLYEKLEAHYGMETMEAMQDYNVLPFDFAKQVDAATESCLGMESSETPSESSAPEVAQVSTPVEVPERSDDRSTASDEAWLDQAIQISASAVAGTEYRDARLTASGDVDGDGRDDAAVVFTIEVPSSNTATQNLAVFVRQDDGSLRFAGSTGVGSQGGAAVGRMAIEQGAVVLTTLSLGPNDPDCCPSVEESTRFELSGGALRQVP